MSVSEQERHELFVVVESAIGTEGAVRLMDHLPPTGWTDVAQKDDVAGIADALDHLHSGQRNSGGRRACFRGGDPRLSLH